jgi:uncharacterized protein
MPDPTTKTPVFRQAWLRVVLFGCAFCLITLLIAVPAIMALTGTGWQDLLSDPVGSVSKLLTGNYLWLLILLEFVISLLSVSIFCWLIDRRKWSDLGWWTLDTFVPEAIAGLFLGPALLGLASIGMLLSGHLEWTDIVWDPNALFISLGYMVLIAFSEELVFRGYILGNLLETFSNKWIALGISAVLFTGYHFASPGTHALAFFNLFLAGILLGLNYIYTKNLWFSFMLHLSWNFFEGPLLGFKVSGISFPSLLQAETKGDLMITGGDFGLEGSMLVMLLLLTAILVLAWAFQRKYGAHTPPTPAQSSGF